MRNFVVEGVPRGWEISRIGHFFEERSEKVSDEDYPPLSVTYDGVVPQLSHVAKTEDRGNRKKVLTGDLVINSRSDRRGASGLSAYDGSVSLINIVLRPRKGSSRFFHYLMRSVPFQEEFYRRGRGIVDDLWTTRFSDLKSIEIAIPDEGEQAKIVEFLDDTTKRIQQLIDKKLRQISVLRERANSLVIGQAHSDEKVEITIDQSHPWLRVLPHGWDVKRAKFLFKCVNRPPEEDDEIVTVFRDGEVTLRKNRRETGYTFAEKEVGYQHVKAGDLVIHTMDAFAGAIGVSDSDGKSTGEYAVCEARGKCINLNYYAQLLRYLAEVGYIFVLCPSVRERAPRFRFSKLAPVYLPVPPRDEQDRASDLIVQLISAQKKIGASVSLLKEYEKKIVSEVVLGRMKLGDTKQVQKTGRHPDQIEEAMRA